MLLTPAMKGKRKLLFLWGAFIQKKIDAKPKNRINAWVATISIALKSGI